jgi:hypothetical protein
MVKNRPKLRKLLIFAIIKQRSSECVKLKLNWGSDTMDIQHSVEQILKQVSGLQDFEVEVKPTFSKRYWAKYYPLQSLVRIYGLNENGEYYPLNILIREGLHEVAHHIQWYHTPGWRRVKGVVHDAVFKEVFADLLNRYNGGELPDIINSKSVASVKKKGG